MARGINSSVTQKGNIQERINICFFNGTVLLWLYCELSKIIMSIFNKKKRSYICALIYDLDSIK